MGKIDTSIVCRRGAISHVGFAATAFLLATATAATSFAASDRELADFNGDGLIEIYDLEDLDAVRDAPFGDSIYGDSSGCPGGACTGFQLENDLDFDTNDDDTVDENDDFYVLTGNGNGWTPIADFSAIFDGKGHTIRNLTREGYNGDDPDFDNEPAGLFSVLDGAQVFDLNLEDVSFLDVGGLTGALAGAAIGTTEVSGVSVVGGQIHSGGSSMLGGVIGACYDSSLEESWSNLLNQPSGMGGGLIGYADDCSIARSFALGTTISSRYHSYMGGLVGYMINGSIQDSFMSGSAGHGWLFGGLIGFTEGSPLVQNSYVSGAVVGNSSGGGAVIGVGLGTFASTFYAYDTTGFNKTRTAGDEAEGVSLADLQCPTTPNDANCRPGMFDGWGATLNSDGVPAWNFGNSQQVPALVIQGVVRRDSDGDGVLDSDDDFPFNWAASKDSDSDGAIDIWREGCDEACRSASGLVLDQFPDDEDVSLDLDLDGFPDAWNPGCNAMCQASSAQVLDPSPDDYDNDSVADLVDQDDDGNGFADIDQDSDNLIDVPDSFTLALINFDPTGASLRTTDYGNSEGIPLGDVSGCRPRIVRGILARECDGYELLADLNMDTNGDGVIDENDIFYNDGAGWYPLGHLGDDVRQAFQTNFEGNGHTIYNLFINRSMESGLFGGIRGANIRNLRLAGDLMNVQGNNGAMTGTLVGDAKGSTISNCSSTGSVFGEGSVHAGGLVGRADGSNIVGSFAAGQVSVASPNSVCPAGGLVGSMYYDSSVTASFASGFVSELCLLTHPEVTSSAGGLVGFADEGSRVSGSFSIGPVSGSTEFTGGLIGLAESDVISSYWSTDTSTQDTSAGNAQGALVDELECPTGANNTSCLSGVTLYAGWDDYVQDGNQPYWDFGNSSELPGLCIDGTVHRVNDFGILQEPAPCSCTASQEELVTNQDFEGGAFAWNALGSSISTSTQQAHTGSSSLRIANRSNAWSGAEYNLLGLAEPGETLETSVWMRVEGDPNEPVVFTMRWICQGVPVDWFRITERTATDQNWVELAGTVQVPDCPLQELVMYAEGPRPGVVLYIDDVSIVSTSLTCGGGGGTQLTGQFIPTNDWGNGYCGEVVFTNTTSETINDWSATFNMNGTSIDPTNYWNIETTGFSGEVTISPIHPWGMVVQPGASIYSHGFCAQRPPGNNSLPSNPVVDATF